MVKICDAKSLDKRRSMKLDILEGDAAEYLSRIDTCSADVIIADPPYNLGKDYGNNNDQKTFDEYLKFSRKWIKESRRILKDTGTIYIYLWEYGLFHIFIHYWKRNITSFLTVGLRGIIRKVWEKQRGFHPDMMIF
jgi:site-specific DNA-methyltransferase (adenine-specific)